ncbi:ferric reductase-like transmembrane domain-containing protein [Microbacterium sp.]|uniref:ferredoxin reductase family protein n=1 Tax=Microbacterium sp. TaxID=51671 RepID=UPI003A849D71
MTTAMIPRRLPPAPLPVASRGRRRRLAARTAWELTAVTLIWGTSLVIAALWVAGGGVHGVLAGGADALNALGRLTGLTSANLLLYQVLLMARIPVFERGFGRDAITRMHRLTGFWSFWLLLVHITLLVFGYAAQEGIDPLAELWTFIWDYPGMLLATAGTALLILIVVTSIRRARRRMRYEGWHLIHLYGYLGVGLAVPHMLWTGSDFLASPLATGYWWTLWAVTAASAVLWRLAVPLIRSLHHDLRVHSVRADGAHGVEVVVTGRELHRLKARAGQFFVWRFLGGPGWTRGNPFSLAADPDGSQLTLSARIVGDGTRRLTTLRPGTRVLVEGPYGTLTGDARRGRRLLMLGAGAGVAPLVSLLEGEDYAPGDAVLVTRDSARPEGLCSDAIAGLQADRGLVHVALDGPRAPGDSPWLPHSHAAWQGSDLLRFLVGDLSDCDVYLCGPPAWMDALIADVRTAGVADTRIHTESFSV